MMSEEDTEIVRETKVRYVHHKSTEEVSVTKNNTGSKYNNLTLAASATDTIVLEKLENTLVTSIRLLNINYRRITPSFFLDYENVTKIEVGCPVSITWMFRYLPRFPALQHFRFGRLAFEERDEDSTSTHNFLSNPKVESYEVFYNVDAYGKLSAEEKKHKDVRIAAALQLGQQTFTNLKTCDIQVPKSIEIELERFLKAFPHIQAGGEKRCRYGEGFVTFTNKQSPKARRLSGNSHSSNLNSKSSSSGNHTNPAKRSSRSDSCSSASSTSTTTQDSSHSSRTPRSTFFLSNKKPKIEVNRDDDDDDDIQCIEDPNELVTSSSADEPGLLERDVKVFGDPRDPRTIRGRRHDDSSHGAPDASTSGSNANTENMQSPRI